MGWKDLQQSSKPTPASGRNALIPTILYKFTIEPLSKTTVDSDTTQGIRPITGNYKPPLGREATEDTSTNIWGKKKKRKQEWDGGHGLITRALERDT